MVTHYLAEFTTLLCGTLCFVSVNYHVKKTLEIDKLLLDTSVTLEIVPTNNSETHHTGFRNSV